MKDEVLKNILQYLSNGNALGEKITLVGATKTVDVNTINHAIKLGLEVVAENKVQEFREKTSLIEGAKQHFIGHLQTNKVKYLVGNVDLIQSVDSVHLAEEINKQAIKKNVVQEILIEVNVGGELSKSGFDKDNVIKNVKALSPLTNVKIVGLMAMLPKNESEQVKADLVKTMRSIYDELKNDFDFKYLSVGMSGDYEIALKNGSNMIRLGSAIFGERNYEV